MTFIKVSSFNLWVQFTSSAEKEDDDLLQPSRIVSKDEKEGRLIGRIKKTKHFTLSDGNTRKSSKR